MRLFELRRKSVHFLGGLALILLLHYEIFTAPHLLILLLFTTTVFFIASRQRMPIIQWVVDTLEREYFRKRFPGKGAIFFLAGASLALFLFQKDIAVASLIILTIGDGISSLFGMEYGRVRHPFSNDKFIEGHIVGALSAFIVVMFFKVFLGLNVTIVPTALAAIVALFIEGIDFKLNKTLIDDNITVPLVSGLVIWLMQLLP